MEKKTIKNFNLKFGILVRIYKIYSDLGIRCFAVKNKKIDKKIWDKSLNGTLGDLLFYLALDNYDFAFERFDGINVGIELIIENGEVVNSVMYEICDRMSV